MRMTLFLLALLGGLILVVTGFVLSAPIGPTTGPVYSNPRVPFAPGIFMLGVVLMFFSAVVYELVPDRRER